jgi:hypothetical protein
MRLQPVRFAAVVLGLLLAFGSTGDAQAWRAKKHGGKHKSGKHYEHRHRHHYGRYSYWSYGWPNYRHSRRDTRYETPTERGFRYLSQDDPKRAVTVFSELAKAKPELALPKLGYALAMSELGELELGVWAMRRAVRTDPDALRDPRIDPALRPRIQALLGIYHPAEEHAETVAHDEDAHFMVAALLWVLGDEAGASSATTWAIRDGDELESTRALADAIRRRASLRVVPDVEADPQ